MVFRRVVHRSELARFTSSAAAEWAEAAAQGVAPLLEPYLEPGEALPDLVLLQKLVARLMADRGEALDSRGDQQARAESSARQARWRRDEASEALREALRKARFYLDSVHGRGYGAKRGIGHGLSRMRPMFLARLGEAIARQLELEAGSSGTREAGLVDPADLAKLVAERAAALHQALQEVLPGVASRSMAVGQKRRSLAETEKLLRDATAFLGGLYKLSNLHGLAKRVRPAFRRPRRRKKGGVEAPPLEESFLETASAMETEWPEPGFADPVAEDEETRQAAPERPEFIRLGIRGVRPLDDPDFPEPPKRRLQNVAVVRRTRGDGG